MVYVFDANSSRDEAQGIVKGRLYRPDAEWKTGNNGDLALAARGR